MHWWKWRMNDVQLHWNNINISKNACRRQFPKNTNTYIFSKISRKRHHSFFINVSLNSVTKIFVITVKGTASGERDQDATWKVGYVIVMFHLWKTQLRWQEVWRAEVRFRLTSHLWIHYWRSRRICWNVYFFVWLCLSVMNLSNQYSWVIYVCDMFMISTYLFRLLLFLFFRDEEH